MIQTGDVRRFLLFAYGGAWLVMAPLWLSGFERTDGSQEAGLGAQVSIAAMMLTPALAAIVVLLRRNSPRDLPRLLSMNRPRLGSCVLAFLATLGLSVASLALATMAGVYEPDFSGFSVLSFFAVNAVGFVLSLPLFLGEELGWQGYLLPRLRPLGYWRALLVMGAIWGLWHLPTVLLGGQFPGYPAWLTVPAVLVGGCSVGVFIGWVRLRTGSVWPTVVAHSVISDVGPRLTGTLAGRGHVVDPLQTGLLGWTGWLVLGAFAAMLAFSRGATRPV
ncbi:CPBP family intramembrane glutamic endopeptidase [Amycolatopsis lurida]